MIKKANSKRLNNTYKCRWHMYVKGANETLLSNSFHIVLSESFETEFGFKHIVLLQFYNQHNKQIHRVQVRDWNGNLMLIEFLVELTESKAVPNIQPIFNTSKLKFI